jgi:hypothetical protein
MQDSDSTAFTDSKGRRGEERAWAAHIAGLRASYHRHLLQPGNMPNDQIESLLAPVIVDAPENWRNWEIPNEIETLLVQMKTGQDLEVALDSAFLTAEKIGVPSFAVLKQRLTKADNDSSRQALLAKLLRDSHNRYAERRSERAERREVAWRLALLGGVVALVFVGLFLALGADFIFASPLSIGLGHFALQKYNLVVCIFFGFLGAFLSRLMAFHSTSGKLSYDDLESGYAWHFLLVRLLVGAFSALVLYLVIAAGILGGELFPNPVPGGGFGQLWVWYESLGYSGPSANFAKLIVWCFIAGFSERFLPDSLSALEAKGRS